MKFSDFRNLINPQGLTVYCISSSNFLCVQEEYRREKIEWRNVAFTDNRRCLDLFAKRPSGLFFLLDEEGKWVASSCRIVDNVHCTWTIISTRYGSTMELSFLGLWGLKINYECQSEFPGKAFVALPVVMRTLRFVYSKLLEQPKMVFLFYPSVDWKSHWIAYDDMWYLVVICWLVGKFVS